jgi:putative colanic acid biosynthesis glycosyltransferase
MRFSVVTVCYNDLQGLQNTCDSLRSQTLGDYEWLVIDGASSDGTVEWLRSLECDRCQWVSEPDAGLYDAMNKGLDRASGDYVIFMNSGDWFAEDSVLERVAGAVDRTEPRRDFVYGDSLDVTESGDRWYRGAKPHTSLWRGMFTQHQAMFFSRARVGNLRYQVDFPLSADYAFIGTFLKGDEKRERATALKLNFPICCFALGGMSWSRRIDALYEDFTIRTNVFGMSLWSSGGLFVAHFAHTYLKRVLPPLTRQMRYREP